MTYPISADQGYFTVAVHGKQVAALTGPFDSHDEAAADLDRAGQLARERFPLDMNVTFATYGVVLAPRRTKVVFPRLALVES